MSVRFTLFTLIVAGAVLAGCGEETYQTTPGAAGGQAGGVTGILLNAQAPNTQETSNMAGKNTTGWTIVDPSGSPIVSSSDVRDTVRGVYYAFKREDATSGKRLWLGANYREFRIASYEVIPGDGELRSFKLVVDASTAAEMRAIPNLSQLIANANLVILTGATGQ